MTVFIITNCIIAVIAFVVGALVLAGNMKGVANQSFFLFASGIAVSSVAKSLLWETGIIFFLAFVAWGFEMIVLGMLCLGFMPSAGKLGRRFLYALVPWCLLFLAIPVFLIASLFHIDPAAYFKQTYQVLLSLFAVIMGAYLLWFIFSSRRDIDIFHLPPPLARGLIWIVAASATIIFLADLVLPLFGVHHFEAASNLVAVAILAVGGYAAARYGTWSGGILLRKVVPYFLSLVCVALIFFGIEFGIEKFFYQNDEVVDIFAASIGALVFYPLRIFFDKLTDRFFFRNPYCFLSAIRELGNRLSAQMDRNVLIATVASFLQSTVRPTEVMFFAINNDEPRATLISGFSGAATVVENYCSLAVLFLKLPRGRTIIADTWRLFYKEHSFSKDEADDVVRARATRLGVAAIVPVIIRGRIKIIMMVGHKCSGALLSKEDVEFLDFAARRAAIAIEMLELHELIEQQTQKFAARVAARTGRLKNMYESQSKFLTDVSHEFKTPLAILKMHASVFAASQDIEQRKAWYVMDTTLDRLSRLVGNLVDVSRLDSPQEKFDKERVDIEELLQDACEDCMILAKDKGIDLRLASDKLSVSGEWDKLKEVILNLVSNALQHTSHGGSISLAAHAVDLEVEIAVRDSGSGISREHLPHIFERFYRIEEDGFLGAGIGLYLCREIIERHNGTIMAESRVGRGSCFKIRLPLLLGDT